MSFCSLLKRIPCFFPMQCGFSKVDKKEPIIVKVYFWGLGWIFAKKVSLVMEDFLLYPQSTGKLEAEEKTYPFWNCQIVQLFKNGSLETSPKNMSIWAQILRYYAIYCANWQTEKLLRLCASNKSRDLQKTPNQRLLLS